MASLTNEKNGRPQDNPQTGRKADLMMAAHLCAEAALRLVKPGNQVTFPPPLKRLSVVMANDRSRDG